MPIAKILSMRSTGSFVWKNGPAAGTTAYGQYIELSDGVAGGANAKSEQPNYKVGDTVEYTIKGQDNRGANKLSVKKLDPSGQPAYQNPVKPQETASNGAPATGNASSIHPATAGCAFKSAVEVLGEAAKDPKQVFELASSYVRVLQKLESGNLAQPKVVQDAVAAAKAAGFTPNTTEPTDENPF